MAKCLHLKIYGRVQGVFFRSVAREKMKELGINGWIQNCEDGAVETEVEGDEGGVEKYREWCMIGPRGAKVERVERGETITICHSERSRSVVEESLHHKR